MRGGIGVGSGKRMGPAPALDAQRARERAEVDRLIEDEGDGAGGIDRVHVGGLDDAQDAGRRGGKRPVERRGERQAGGVLDARRHARRVLSGAGERAIGNEAEGSAADPLAAAGHRRVDGEERRLVAAGLGADGAHRAVPEDVDRLHPGHRALGQREHHLECIAGRRGADRRIGALPRDRGQEDEDAAEGDCGEKSEQGASAGRVHRIPSSMRPMRAGGNAADLSIACGPEPLTR